MPKGKKTASKLNARKAIEGIKKPQIRRIALRAGIDSVSGLVFEEIRTVLQRKLEILLKTTVIITQHSRRRTVDEKDVRLAINVLGNQVALGRLDIYNIPEGGKRKKLNSIRSEKAKNSLLFDRSSFARLIRNVEVDYHYKPFRYSRQSLFLIQCFLENYLHEIFSHCALLLKQQGRTTVEPKHIQLVQALTGEGTHGNALTPAIAITVDETKKKNRLPANNLMLVLKQVHPDTGIDAGGKSVMNQLIASLVSKVLAVTHELLTHTDTKTVNSRAIQSAIRIVLPEELSMHAVSEGTKAVTKFNAAGAERRAGASLTISIARIDNMIRSARVAPRVGAGAPIYLAAVVEYFIAEIFELAGNAARDHKKVRITPKHIAMALKNDEELKQLFGNTMYSIAM